MITTQALTDHKATNNKQKHPKNQQKSTPPTEEKPVGLPSVGGTQTHIGFSVPKRGGHEGRFESGAGRYAAPTIVPELSAYWSRSRQVAVRSRASWLRRKPTYLLFELVEIKVALSGNIKGNFCVLMLEAPEPPFSLKF